MEKDVSKSKIPFQIVIIVVVAVVVIVAIALLPKGAQSDKNMEEFARCLSDKGAVMYGAYWCSHCQNEKKAFGKAFRFINYVECTEETAKCAEQKIEGYPTWIFPDGKSLLDDRVEKLSEISGCLIGTSTTQSQS